MMFFLPLFFLSFIKQHETEIKCVKMREKYLQAMVVVQTREKMKFRLSFDLSSSFSFYCLILIFPLKLVTNIQLKIQQFNFPSLHKLPSSSFSLSPTFLLQTLPLISALNDDGEKAFYYHSPGIVLSFTGNFLLQKFSFVKLLRYNRKQIMLMNIKI